MHDNRKNCRFRVSVPVHTLYTQLYLLPVIRSSEILKTYVIPVTIRSIKFSWDPVLLGRCE